VAESYEDFKDRNKDAEKALNALMREVHKRTTACEIHSITIKQGEEQFIAVVKEGQGSCNTTLLSVHWGYTKVDAIWLSSELEDML